MIAKTLSAALAEIDAAGLRRRQRPVDSACGPLTVVDGRELLAFCSNDYLGLAADPRLVEAVVAGVRRWGAGSGASHLVSGHLRPHQSFEEEAAAFMGRERALLYGSGYLANIGIVPALVGRGDAVFSDRLNHASLIDAVVLSRAESHRYPHLDVSALASLLERSPARRKLIVTDGVFSMDGDLAPLSELFALAERHDAWLFIDDAHGFGVLGPQGRGSAAHAGLPPSPRLLSLGTLGKAAGLSGAFVCGAAEVIEWLLQKSRSHTFTTAPSPAISVALSESLRLIAEADARRAHLAALIGRLRRGLAGLPWCLLPSETAIQPLIVGGNEEALALSEALFARGIWVPAIRPPTVPVGEARLRITLSAAHTDDQVERLIDALRSAR